MQFEYAFFIHFILLLHLSQNDQVKNFRAFRVMIPDPVELPTDMAAANEPNVGPPHQIVFESEYLFTRIMRNVKKGKYFIIIFCEQFF